MIKHPCIIAAGHSYKTQDIPILNDMFTTYVINHASRGYDDLNLFPDHYLFLDQPRTFSTPLFENEQVTKHCSRSHKLWFNTITNYKLYDFNKTNKPKDKHYWYDPDIDPFKEYEKTGLINYPYLTFLFTLQIVVSTKPEKIYFYGCDFIISKEQNYYFDSKLNNKQYRGKRQGIDNTVKIFAEWMKYIPNTTKLYSLSKISKLNDYIEYYDIENLKKE